MRAIMGYRIGRRTFLTGGLGGRPVIGTGALAARSFCPTRGAQFFGHGGSEFKAPPGSCDCHHHIYDAPAFPPVSPQSRMQVNASVKEYKLLQRRLGITRDIVVTPAPYVTDNRVTLDAIKQLGPNARGVAVLHPDVTDAELKTLDDGGIRGIRFSVNDTTIANTRVDMIEPLAKRIAPLGWHIQVNMGADQIARLENLWNRVPTGIVFDHMGHIPEPQGIVHPAYAVIRRLIDKGKTWVKLSVTYDNTKDGPPGYADISRVAQDYVKTAPERLVWGSNWPHPNETMKPDDALVFDLLAKWAPDEAIRRKILVDNPAKLYGFT